MTVEPFRNEPIETFQTEEARRAMREALRRVREEFGRHYPLYIGGEWVDTKERMVSLNPSAPSEVVGTTAKAGKAEAEAAEARRAVPSEVGVVGEGAGGEEAAATAGVV